MIVIIHDLNMNFDIQLREKYENVIHADGQYAPCQGCFQYWTKSPASCYMKDRLQTVSRLVDQADELIIYTENYYGAYSPFVKNFLTDVMVYLRLLVPFVINKCILVCDMVKKTFCACLHMVILPIVKKPPLI